MKFAVFPLIAWGLLGILSAANTPNILLILADDLGFSDLGCHGGEIETPHLDGLALNGLRFTQFYNTARCWPSRAAILTGYYAQQVRRDTIPNVPSGNRGKRPAWAQLLPEHLKPLGYRSYHSGKWHLDGLPLENGFDHSYYLKDQGRFFNPQVHYQDDKPLPPVEKSSGFYGTTAIADHAIECLRDHASNHSKAPFFHYLAFTAPHFPLHALPEDIAKYEHTYTKGWDAIRQDRWQRLRKLGIIGEVSLSQVEQEIGPPCHFPKALETLGVGEVNRPLSWASLTDEQKSFQAGKMAIHAAMIDRMDQEIGRVLTQLRSMKAFDDTLVVFLSDNGASAEIMVRSDGHDPDAAPGSAASYLCLGPGWSTVSNTPFRRHKTWVHEGGTATPMIAHWPKGIAARGELRHRPGHVIDLFPTILDLAKGTLPKSGPTHPGRSIVSAFSSQNSDTSTELWWCHEGHRAYRRDHWKLVSSKDGPWELYDLGKDRAETNNLSEKHPLLVQSLEAAWNKRWNEFQRQATP